MAERTAALREIAQEYAASINTFCHYLLYGQDHEELVLEIFREFGDAHRRLSRIATPPDRLRIELFQIAWRLAQEAHAVRQPPALSSVDARPMYGRTEDLLKLWAEKSDHAADLELCIGERVAQIDFDYRAVVVLRDILKIEHEEVAKILGLRWAVYRHRLHRGRLELRDCLRRRWDRVESAPRPLREREHGQ